MTTARDIVQDALEMLGVYAAGETMTDADAERGLTRLNNMMDSWSNESLSCYQILEQSGAMQVGVASYSIGTGGTFNMTRPLRISDAPGSAYLQDTNGNNYPVKVVPRDYWNLIGSRIVTSNVPDTLFYDPQYPLGIINVFPVPTINWTLFWDSFLQLTDFANLSATLSLPPGYELAIKTNLALHLKPYFSVANIDPLVIEQARESKANIKRTNLRPETAKYDPEIVARAQGSYNIYSDRNG